MPKRAATSATDSPGSCRRLSIYSRTAASKAGRRASGARPGLPCAGLRRQPPFQHEAAVGLIDSKGAAVHGRSLRSADRETDGPRPGGRAGKRLLARRGRSYPDGISGTAIAAEQRHLTGHQRTARPSCSMTHSDLSWMFRKSTVRRSGGSALASAAHGAACPGPDLPRRRPAAPIRRQPGRDPGPVPATDPCFADRLAKIGKAFGFGDIGGAPNRVPPLAGCQDVSSLAGAAAGVAKIGRSEGRWQFAGHRLAIRPDMRHSC